MIALSLAAGALYQIGHGPGYSLTAATCLGVGLSALWVRQWLLPRINAARDAQLAGAETAGRRFDRDHKLSVVINIVQLLVLVAMLVTR
jgi:hypothetical protein